MSNEKNSTTSNKDETESSENTNSQSDGSNSTTSSKSSSNTNSNYSVTSTTTSNNSSQAISNVKKNNSNAQQSQVTMTATDAKNIVKEHIGNQLSDRGIAGQSISDLPSIDSVDGYTATQNGTNNWTVSGNGHTYHVTANSVTGN